MSRRTANNKLTNMYRRLRKRSPKRQIVLVAPKMGRGTTQILSGPLPGRVLPHFQIRSRATARPQADSECRSPISLLALIPNAASRRNNIHKIIRERLPFLRFPRSYSISFPLNFSVIFSIVLHWRTTCGHFQQIVKDRHAVDTTSIHDK